MPMCRYSLAHAGIARLHLRPPIIPKLITVHAQSVRTVRACDESALAAFAAAGRTAEGGSHRWRYCWRRRWSLYRPRGLHCGYNYIAACACERAAVFGCFLSFCPRARVSAGPRLIPRTTRPKHTQKKASQRDRMKTDRANATNETIAVAASARQRHQRTERNGRPALWGRRRRRRRQRGSTTTTTTRSCTSARFNFLLYIYTYTRRRCRRRRTYTPYIREQACTPMCVCVCARAPLGCACLVATRARACVRL